VMILHQVCNRHTDDFLFVYFLILVVAEALLYKITLFIVLYSVKKNNYISTDIESVQLILNYSVEIADVIFIQEKGK
jgi:hypothetical protein